MKVLKFIGSVILLILDCILTLIGVILGIDLFLDLFSRTKSKK